MGTAEFPLIRDRSQLFDRAAVVGTPSPVPRSPGLYAWFFDEAPPGIDLTGCYSASGLSLLYIGISPREPPANGKPASRSTLRHRLRTHYAGNAEGSTLRKTLGCLLADRLGIELRRVGSGNRRTFTNRGEQELDSWMGEHALVAWMETDRPWELELTILRSGLRLPLNVRDNPSLELTTVVQRARRRWTEHSNGLPILADNGGPRRRSGP